jgi:primosomal protein N'
MNIREFAEGSAKSIGWLCSCGSTATCFHCSAVFTTAVQGAMSTSSHFVLVSRRPCPACGSHALRSAGGGIRLVRSGLNLEERVKT